MWPDLGHEVRPATCGVVDGVQLLQEGGGVGQGEVPLQQTAHQLAVRGIQQLGVSAQVRGQLREVAHAEVARSK